MKFLIFSIFEGWQPNTRPRSDATTSGQLLTWELCQPSKGTGCRMGLFIIQISLRMVEEFRMRVKENIEADPLGAVAKVYEEELTRIKEQLGEDLDEFTAACPTLFALSPSMYR